MLNFPWTRKPDFSTVQRIDYDKYWGIRGEAINKQLKDREQIIMEYVEQGSTVFDVGCGNSLLPIELSKKNCEVVVGDVSASVLLQYTKFGLNTFNIDLEDSDTWRELPRYDYLILSEVLEHLRNPEVALSGLKPHGKTFIISIPNSAFIYYRMGLLFSGRFFTQWVYHPSEHLRFWSHIDFLDWLDALGFDVINTQTANGFSFKGWFPFLKHWRKNLFAHQIVYFCKPRLLR